MVFWMQLLYVWEEITVHQCVSGENSMVKVVVLGRELFLRWLCVLLGDLIVVVACKISIRVIMESLYVSVFKDISIVVELEFGIFSSAK